MDIADLREKLEDNRMYVIIGAAALIGLSLISLVSGGGPATLGGSTTLIYYDLDQQTIKLVEHDAEQGEPPVSPLPGTDNVFLASVWYCGDTPDVDLSEGMTLQELQDKGLFIAWLEKDDPQGQVNAFGTRSLLYRTLDDPTWQKAETLQSLAIIESPLDRCEDAAQYFVR